MSALSKLLGTDTKNEESQADDLVRQATGAYSNIDLPDLENPDLFEYSDLGGYDPSLVTAPTLGTPNQVTANNPEAALSTYTPQGETAFSDIEVDPRLQSEQYDSLAALDDIIQGGGMTAQDQANMARIQSETSQADRGRRGAILQNMQERGMGGSGNELLAQLQSSQAATDRASQRGLDVAGMAQQRALESIMQSGKLAGGMRDQDWGEQGKIASAQDAISRFNTGNTLQNNQFNTGSVNTMATRGADRSLETDKFNVSNDFDADKFRATQGLAAQTTNAGAINTALGQKTTNTQDVSNRNVGVQNTQVQAGAALPQKQFENKGALASGTVGALKTGIDHNNAKVDRKKKEEAEYIKGGIKGAIAAAGGA